MARMARLLATALLAAPACGPPAQLRYEARLDRTPAPARHAVHSERLQELMRSLDALSLERLPQAMDVEVERERRAEEIAAVARAIADTARKIPVATAGIELDADEREAFERSAVLLSERAEQLGRDGAMLTPEEIRGGVDAIEATCKGCHRQFHRGEDRDP